ncbi:aldo/keto reductase [Paraburkholderia sp. J12]|uniref:aldo/keto reductase n=1 Tax=Paraburkholderia sp. J12 TaxID=2805432 RepID=UPI002ABD330C|nr:aldo/keto reductase [Paraburkholderia sp. J12]
MDQRKLGAVGPTVSSLGLGCMGMSTFYAGRDDAESVRTVHRAVELGVTLFDTADMYGDGENERLLGRALAPLRSRVLIATKFGQTRAADGTPAVDGRPEYVRAACEASLKRLDIDVIDLYYQHRVDPKVPIEETVGAMSDLVNDGKVRFIGLSEAAPATVRRAHAVHPLAAVQTEYSLWSRDPEAVLLPTLRELGIGFVPYSPLGRGFLTGSFDSAADVPNDDIRRTMPRFQPGNFEHNRALVELIASWAKRKSCTPGQLALAWVLAQGDDVVPIPGTKRRAYLEENIAAKQVVLTRAEADEISALLPPGSAQGLRYPAAIMGKVDL